jgi:recombinational DNA repair ATPase RecF
LLAVRGLSLGELEEHTRDAYDELAPDGGRLGLEIRGTVKVEDPADRNRMAEAFAEALAGSRARERMMRHGLTGPHRDRLEVTLKDRSLAQGELLYERTKERPVVVLDDIFSELDRVRTEALQHRLHREHQLFIATARIDHVLALEGWEQLKVWVVRDGDLTEVDHLDRSRLEELQEGRT